VLHQVGVSFVLYYDARKHKIKSGAYGKLLIVPADGRWDLTLRLKS